MLAFLGGPEVWVLVLIALVLFGGKRLPELARSLGQSVQEFKRGISGIRDEIEKPPPEPPPPRTPEPPKA